MTKTSATAVLSGPDIDTEICFCCMERNPALRHLQAWWQPSPGHGYGPDGRTITLCQGCIESLQFFVELGGAPPRQAR